jgi:DNA repair protein RecO (recombination protein O)
MDWQDRRHGESDAILTVLTREHGQHLGIVKGGTGRRQRAVMEVGARWARFRRRSACPAT